MPKMTERGAEAAPQGNGNRKCRDSQCDLILEHIKKYGSITSATAAYKYGIMRMSGRIFDLRRMGYNIETDYEISQYGVRYGVYTLKEDNDAGEIGA